MVSDVTLLQRLWLFHLRQRILKMSPFIGVHTSFALRVLMLPSAPILQCPRVQCLLSRFLPAYNTKPRNVPGKTFGPNWCNLDMFFAEIGWYSTIAPNGITGPSKGHSEPPFIWCLPIRQEILNVSHIAVTLHGIRPPFIVEIWLQQYRRCPFLHSEHCSFCNPICFWSVWRWRTMIPG